MEAMFEWEDIEEDKEDKVVSSSMCDIGRRSQYWMLKHRSFPRSFQDSEPKGFMDKLYAIQDVFISVQSALDEVASYGERIKKWAF